ncbi:carbohydrate kinase family protein [Patescibacteria group bacterium]
MFNVVCFGGATQDNIIKIASTDAKFQEDSSANRDLLCFEHGAKIPVEDAVSDVGGGALNTSVAYSQLGLKTAIVSATGQDHFSENIRKRLAQYKVDDTFLAELTGVHTGFSTIITTFKGDRTAFVYRGSNDFISRDLFADFDDLSTAEWFSISHLSGNSNNLHKDIIDLKKKNPDIRIAWNPGFTQISSGLENLKPLLRLTEVLIINRREAEVLTGRSSSEETIKEDMRGIAQELLELGPKIVVISDGEGGAFVLTHKSFYEANVFPVNLVNTTGAGDAFMAGFVSGLHYSKNDVEVALSYGSANASGVISQFGAQKGIMTLKEIKKKVESTPEFEIRKEKP